MHTSFRNLPIRYKLLLTYSAVFIGSLALGGVITYSMVRKTIESNIESELKNSTSAIYNMVKTSVAVSIKNHLRAVAEKNREIVAHFYRRYRDGRLTEEEAKDRAAEVLLSQTIGKTGYIYCLNSDGVVVLHPKRALLGVDVSDHGFVREQKARKEGYLEYQWKNPGEAFSRPKALYMTYFEPWDWILSVSTYRDEFHELLNVEDLREGILSMKFGRTGYSYVTDAEGNTVIHPVLRGVNIFEEENAPAQFFREMLERKSGKMVYSWKNPGEKEPREKLVIYNFIPEYQWIVASSSYLDEFYSPLDTVRGIFLATALGSLLLALPITIRVSSSITSPLKDLMGRLAAGAEGDLSVRLRPRSDDEVGQLAGYFNTFMERLERYHSELEGEIRDREQAEQALRLSEEMFSKAFRSSPNGIGILRMADRRFVDVNDSLLAMTGLTREEVIDRAPADLGVFPDAAEGRRLARALGEAGHLRNREVEFRTRSGEVRLGRLSAEIIEVSGQRCMLCTLEDVTEQRRLEREVIDIGDRERRKIGQDLHDDLGPHLIGIEVLSKLLAGKLRKTCPEEAALADRIRGLIAEGAQKTRALARGLCPVHLAENGFEFALEELAQNTQKIYGVPCELRCRAPVGPADSDVATQLYYIAREAVHNAVKHAQATGIVVELSAAAGRVHLAVGDDGTGIPEAPEGKGMGLRIMGFRAGVIGGSLEIESRPGGGTTVRVSAPTDAAGWEPHLPEQEPPEAS
ncbi:MAG: hypothetical protein Kow0092_04620 [Deferrisomatales bacterium]